MTSHGYLSISSVVLINEIPEPISGSRYDGCSKKEQSSPSSRCTELGILF